MESDLALLERFLGGDEEAFTEIVERYQKKNELPRRKQRGIKIFHKKRKRPKGRGIQP